MTTDTDTTDIATQHKEWQAKNPLREWRKKNRVTIHGAAGLIGCAMSTIQLWEAGASQPSDDYMDKLVKIIGPNTERRWNRWLDKNPADNL